MKAPLSIKTYTVNFGYKEPGYSVHSDIMNTFQIPDFYPSLFYIKKYGYSELGHSVHSAIRNEISGPKVPKSA